MTTIYRNNRQRGGWRQVLVVGGALAVLLVAGYFLRAPLDRTLGKILSPIWRASDASGAALWGIPDYFRGVAHLQRERDALRAELASSRLSVLDRNLLFEENLMLKEAIGRIAQPNALLAAVLVRPPETPYDMLIIDVGERAQVRVGDKVAASGTLLIGEVESVWDSGARVRLYSAPGTSRDGFLRGTIPIRVEGIGGGSLRAEVPYDAQALAGDLVNIPAIEPNVAFLVEHVEAGRGDSAAIIHLRLPVNPFSLKFVEVWRSAYAQ